MMSYKNTFIRVAEDCPVETGVIPVSARELRPHMCFNSNCFPESPISTTMRNCCMRFMCGISKSLRRSGCGGGRRFGMNCSPKTTLVCGPRCCPSVMAGESITTMRERLPYTAGNLRNMTILFQAVTK